MTKAGEITKWGIIITVLVTISFIYFNVDGNSAEKFGLIINGLTLLVTVFFTSQLVANDDAREKRAQVELETIRLKDEKRSDDARIRAKLFRMCDLGESQQRQFCSELILQYRREYIIDAYNHEYPDIKGNIGYKPDPDKFANMILDLEKYREYLTPENNKS